MLWSAWKQTKDQKNRNIHQGSPTSTHCFVSLRVLQQEARQRVPVHVHHILRSHFRDRFPSVHIRASRQCFWTICCCCFFPFFLSLPNFSRIVFWSPSDYKEPVSFWPDTNHLLTSFIHSFTHSFLPSLEGPSVCQVLCETWGIQSKTVTLTSRALQLVEWQVEKQVMIIGMTQEDRWFLVSIKALPLPWRSDAEDPLDSVLGPLLSTIYTLPRDFFRLHSSTYSSVPELWTIICSWLLFCLWPRPPPGAPHSYGPLPIWPAPPEWLKRHLYTVTLDLCLPTVPSPHVTCPLSPSAQLV